MPEGPEIRRAADRSAEVLVGEAGVTDSRKWVAYLAVAGLLPMAAATLLVHEPLAQNLLRIYSLAILAFLAGSWWMVGLMNRTAGDHQRRSVLIFSNLVVVIAVSLAVFLPSMPLLLLGYAALFAALLIGEMRLSPFAPQPIYYRRIRALVSVVAMSLHLVAATTLLMSLIVD